MLKNKTCQLIITRLALVLNLAGTICLALAFQATTSDFRFISYVNHNSHKYAICANETAIVAADTNHSFSGGTGNCDYLSDNGSKVAIVVSNSPNLLKLGFGLSIFAFLLQIGLCNFLYPVIMQLKLFLARLRKS